MPLPHYSGGKNSQGPWNLHYFGYCPNCFSDIPINNLGDNCRCDECDYNFLREKLLDKNSMRQSKIDKIII